MDCFDRQRRRHPISNPALPGCGLHHFRPGGNFHINQFPRHWAARRNILQLPNTCARRGQQSEYLLEYCHCRDPVCGASTACYPCPACRNVAVLGHQHDFASFPRGQRQRRSNYRYRQVGQPSSDRFLHRRQYGKRLRCRPWTYKLDRYAEERADLLREEHHR